MALFPKYAKLEMVPGSPAPGRARHFFGRTWHATLRVHPQPSTKLTDMYSTGDQRYHTLHMSTLLPYNFVQPIMRYPAYVQVTTVSTLAGSQSGVPYTLAHGHASWTTLFDLAFCHLNGFYGSSPHLLPITLVSFRLVDFQNERPRVQPGPVRSLCCMASP
jgi:hypothetical protein